MAKRFTVDGLWLCLCPSFGRLVTERLSSGLPRTKGANAHAKPFKRALSTAAAGPRSTRNAERSDTTAAGATDRSRRPKWWRHQQISDKDNPKHPDQLHSSRWRTEFRITAQFMHNKSNADLEQQLQKVVGKRPNYVNALIIVRTLIEQRGVQPATRHYKALMLANSEPLRGSALQVRDLLKEMDEHGIVADSGILHAVLKTLAVHPDYILRHEILQRLRERWISLSPAGWHSVITGYLREGQFEMALKSLSHMEAQDIPVEDWLYGLLIYNLCDAEEFDEALRLMRSRLGRGHVLSPNLWYGVLDMACDALHEELVSFIWQRRVTTGYLNASYGMCNTALMIASRSGNVDLATSVFKTLEGRKATFSQNDYEALIDTYAAAGDIMSGFRVLCVMKKTGIGATESSTPSLLSQLIWAQTDPLDAWDMLKRLDEEEKLEVPTAAVNAIIAYCGRRVDAESAMTIYRELHLICPEGPSTETFNNLIRVCGNARRLDMASFYVAEMRQLNVLPSRLTYTNLIFVCLFNQRFVDARRYFLEMAQSGFGMSETRRNKILSTAADSVNTAARELRVTVTVTQPTSRVDSQRKPQRVSELLVSDQSPPHADAVEKNVELKSEQTFWNTDGASEDVELGSEQSHSATGTVVKKDSELETEERSPAH